MADIENHVLVKRQEADSCEPDFVAGDITWVIMSTAMVMLMIPGLGYFYSGLARHKNALSMIFLVMMTLAVVSLQWFLFGYSLTFSPSGNPFIGNFTRGVLHGVGGNRYACEEGGQSTLPENLFMVFQGMFASITPALAFGGVAERSRILPLIVFLVLWSTIVYDPIAYWTWSPQGWLYEMGSLDAAGGTPVHINSGAAALALSLVLGKRKGHGKEHFKPHNLSNVFLGTALLWFGWLGFNGGSIFAANARAVNSVIVTNLSAAVGAITWVALDYVRGPAKARKWSAFGFCAGAVAGLVSITPASGFVSPASSILFGFLAGVGCWFVAEHKLLLLKPFDDALDVFAVHGVGGIIGNILTGIFAQSEIVALDGTPVEEIEAHGWLDGNFGRIGPQFAGAAAGFAWSFVVTFIIAFVMDKIPPLRLRVKDEQENIGVDVGQFGESAYEFVNVMPGDLEKQGLVSPADSQANGPSHASSGTNEHSEQIASDHKTPLENKV